VREKCRRSDTSIPGEQRRRTAKMFERLDGFHQQQEVAFFVSNGSPRLAGANR